MSPFLKIEKVLFIITFSFLSFSFMEVLAQPPAPNPTASPTPTTPPYKPPQSKPQILKYDRLEDKAKLCVIGDGGSGEVEQFSVAKILDNEECDHIYYVGDIIYEKGINSPYDPEFKKRFYKPYESILKEDVPFHMIMGNHDYGGIPGAWLELAKIYQGHIIFPNYYFAEDFVDVCFIGIDTNRTWEKMQIEWIKSTLQKFKESNCKLSVAFAHHPYSSSGEYSTGDPKRRAFLDETVMGKVDIYLAGHDHIISDELMEKGTQLLVSGGGGQGLYPLSNRPT